MVSVASSFALCIIYCYYFWPIFCLLWQHGVSCSFLFTLVRYFLYVDLYSQTMVISYLLYFSLVFLHLLLSDLLLFSYSLAFHFVCLNQWLNCLVLMLFFMPITYIFFFISVIVFYSNMVSRVIFFYFPFPNTMMLIYFLFLYLLFLLISSWTDYHFSFAWCLDF